MSAMFEFLHTKMFHSKNIFLEQDNENKENTYSKNSFKTNSFVKDAKIVCPNNLFKKINVNKNNNTRDGNSATMNETCKNEDKYKDKSTMLFTNENDLLFWYIYYNIYGDAFDRHKLFEIEKNTKFKWIEKIENEFALHKQIFKKLKVKKNDVVSNLGNDSKMNLTTLFCVIVVFNLNICLIQNRLVMVILGNSDIMFDALKKQEYEDTNVYMMNINHLMNVKQTYIHIETSTISSIENKYIFTNNLHKPIKSIHSYTLAELQSICETLQLSLVFENNNKKKTKKDLYGDIEKELIMKSNNKKY